MSAVSPGTPSTPDHQPDPVPPALAARPRDPRRGLPIPPVNVHPDPATGAPVVDFTTLNTITSTHLASIRQCSLCGEVMGYWCALFGGPRSAELMRYTDPPACPPCLTAAITLCPYIAIERHRRARAELAGAGTLPPGSHGDRPPYWVLGITRTYRTMFVGAPGHAVYLPAPFRTIHTYTYGADGRIDPHPTTRHG